MGLVGYTFGFMFTAGLIGQISLSNRLRLLPAHKNIDHPSKPIRVFFRLMAFFMCQMWSFFLTAALLGALPLESHSLWVKHLPEFARATYLLVMPLPLATLLYVLYVKMGRWASRREAARMRANKLFKPNSLRESA